MVICIFTFFFLRLTFLFYFLTFSFFCVSFFATFSKNGKFFFHLLLLLIRINNFIYMISPAAALFIIIQKPFLYVCAYCTRVHLYKYPNAKGVTIDILISYKLTHVEQKYLQFLSQKSF